MSNDAATLGDWIDAILRPAMGFFAGMALGHTAKLAEVSSWSFAIMSLIIIAVFFSLVMNAIYAMDLGLGRLIERSIGVKYPNGIKPAKRPAAPRKRHWFIRFGWLPAMLLGAIAIFVLPECVLEWL